MSLFDLPAELVRQVLHALDPASFYQCLQTSKVFREHAFASTTLMHEQLACVPGQRRFPSDVASDAAALMAIFSKRAAQHLVTGISRMADVTIWKAPPSMDRKISSIVRWGSSNEQHTWKIDHDHAPATAPRPPPNSLLLLEVLPDEATINVHLIHMDAQESTRPRLIQVVSPNLISQHLPQYDKSGSNEYRVVKVVTGSQYGAGFKMAALYSPKHPPVDSDLLDSKVIFFGLDSDIGPIVLSVYDVPALEGYQPVAMAVDKDGGPTITWRRCTIYPVEYHKIIKYKHIREVSLSEPGTMETAEVLFPTTVCTGERITDMAIHGSCTHLIPSTIPLPFWTANRTERFVFRDTAPPEVVGSFSRHLLGRTIAQHHHHMVETQDLNDGEPTCVNTALELVITRAPITPDLVQQRRHGAFLLKAIQYPDSCEDFDDSDDYQSRDYVFQHVFAAQLVGLPDLQQLSTLGLKLAVSPCAHRIAIASWRTLVIYAVDPKAFLDPDYSLSCQEGILNDYAFTEECGWEYYSSGDFYKGCVLLEPIEVECTGVVFGLEWRCEDELWGWTEHGVVRWRVGVHATGEREIAEL